MFIILGVVTRKESGLLDVVTRRARLAPNEKLSNSNGTFVLLMLIFYSPDDAAPPTRLLVGRVPVVYYTNHLSTSSYKYRKSLVK